MGRGPARRRGEAPGKGERRDRPPRGSAEDATERGKGWIVEGRSGGDAEQQPDREVSGGMIGVDEQGEAERGNERADRHDAMSAMPVDQRSDARRNYPRREQRERKATHGKGHRPAAFVSDQRHSQDRWIENRAPSQNLGDAEHEDGAPRAGDDIGQRRHGGSTRGNGGSLARLAPASI